MGTYSWRQFRYVWEPEPGEYTIYSRATDDQGRSQPATISDPDDQLVRITDEEFPWNQGGYAATAYEPHGVTVTVAEGEAETPGGETTEGATAAEETTTPATDGGETTPEGGEATTVGGGETTPGDEATTTVVEETTDSA